MLTIDCPICSGTATTDDDLATVSCDACGVTADVSPDPVVPTLDIAA
jgi:hypothetical protein